jgi:uncharacterized protein involved in type VI secretion and phage assembly
VSLEDVFDKPGGKDRQYGVVIGVVTSTKDDEGLGRVKVKFPWRGEEPGGEAKSHLARVASLMAGKDRGMVFLPEVEDEVLVAFEQGDLNYPYIIGSLWNSEDKHPQPNSDGKNNIRKIKSRSGHEIIFDDDSEQKKEKVEIHTKANHQIILDDAAGQEKIEIIDKTGSNKITFDSVQNSISIESTMQLKIKAQKIDIEAGGTMTIKSSGILTLQGSLIKIN